MDSDIRLACHVSEPVDWRGNLGEGLSEGSAHALAEAITERTAKRTSRVNV